MNEELQKQIAEILKQALAAAQHGGQWLQGQLPEVLHQLIVWTIVCGIGAFFVGAILLVVTIVGWVKLIRWILDDEKWGMREFSAIPASIVSVFLLFLVAQCFCSFMNAMEAIFAPKLFLLEYAAHMVH